MSIRAAIQSAGRNRLKVSAIGIGIVAYIGAIAYSGVRSWDLMSRTLPTELLGFAVLGILVLELSALALPLALHYWTIDGWHRTSAYAFYVVDMILVAANAILDNAHFSGSILPGFMAWYSTWVVPAMPIMVGAGWAVLLALDPHIQRQDKLRAMQAKFEDSIHEQTLAELDTEEIRAIASAAARRGALEIAGLARAPRIQAPQPQPDTKPEPTPAPARVVEVAPTTSPKAPSRNGVNHG